MGSNPVIYRLNPGVELLPDIHLLTKLLLEWELHVSMKFNSIQNYKLKLMFPPSINHDRWGSIL
jgi:hypothetical protein